MPLAAKRDTSGISRTPSPGVRAACQSGLAYPLQVPPTTPVVAGDPGAQPLGPPLPAATACKPSEMAVALLQNPFAPYVVLFPRYVARRTLAQESFHGISGM